VKEEIKDGQKIHQHISLPAHKSLSKYLNDNETVKSWKICDPNLPEVTVTELTTTNPAHETHISLSHPQQAVAQGPGYTSRSNQALQ
jgi:hypothetical protein